MTVAHKNQSHYLHLKNNNNVIFALKTQMGLQTIKQNKTTKLQVNGWPYVCSVYTEIMKCWKAFNGVCMCVHDAIVRVAIHLNAGMRLAESQ